MIQHLCDNSYGCLRRLDLDLDLASFESPLGRRLPMEFKYAVQTPGLFYSPSLFFLPVLFYFRHRFAFLYRTAGCKVCFYFTLAHANWIWLGWSIEFLSRLGISVCQCFLLNMY